MIEMKPPVAPEEARYRAARERAEMVQGLYIHIIVYATVNLGLFALNALIRDPGGDWWFQWPLLGWGIGVLVHISVVLFPVFSQDWVERRTQRYL